MDVCEALIVSPVDADGWSQLNVTVSESAGSLRGGAWSLFDGLERWLEEAQRPEAIELWFVRKAPGLRIRVRGPGLDVAARDRLEALLQAEQARGVVDGWGWATYEPEVARLGGTAGLRLVHAWLSESTRVWLGWQRLSRSGGTRLGRDVMALILQGELLLRSLGAPEEAWDVWLSLLRAYELTTPAVPPRDVGGARGLPLAAIAGRASPAERALLERGQAAADAFAAGLARAHDECTLQGGRRALLGTVASFSFNLWCLSPSAIVALCRMAVRELDPRPAPSSPRTMEPTP
ncbi:thiopeptide-type bacteriocin biosynthesis protein [Paraliomyxa miuraensis]|uniref:thiopeptide-type bacteriocin biosynthesis protein n=1 Tax=Paraliomyxa miuraensis TaxID=376150 RepID=UPI0022567DE9|nr:thiopeptide-type bacteriocin biosynthesis protein [Paraliomyxa miuraensis]MCX4247476.1 thiopeptide-type bacteriocin biosynthesis protein [Paraliomyxa miuraensis]